MVSFPMFPDAPCDCSTVGQESRLYLSRSTIPGIHGCERLRIQYIKCTINDNPLLSPSRERADLIVGVTWQALRDRILHGQRSISQGCPGIDPC